jgi:type IV pilus assembly protein PilV
MKPRRAPPPAQRGLGLLDALIAMALLAFGLLGLAGLQARLVQQTTESQQRATANQLGNELLHTALVDSPANVGCYTLPASGSCGNSTVRARTNDWGTRVAAALPGTVTATSVAAGTRLTVTIGWTGKASDEPRSLTLVSDVQ